MKKLHLPALCILPFCFAALNTHAQTLPEIAGLSMHMDANNMSSLVMDGNSVYAWNDSSGRNIQFTPNTPGAVTYQSDVVNGLGALHFDGSSGSFLQTTSPDALGLTNDIGGITVFTVAFNTWPASSGTQTLLRIGQGTGEAGGGNPNTLRFTMARRHTATVDDHQLQYRRIDGTDGGGSRTVRTDTGISTREAWGIDTAYVNYAEAEVGMLINGELMYHDSDDSLGTGNTSATDSQMFRIGSSENTNQTWNGNIAEILIFDRVLTEEEMFQVHSYLGEKYGIGIIPEPSTYALILAGGMLALAFLKRRRK